MKKAGIARLLDYYLGVQVSPWSSNFLMWFRYSLLPPGNWSWETVKQPPLWQHSCFLHEPVAKAAISAATKMNFLFM